MNSRVARKYFYQKWRGHSSRNNTKREIVFLLLGAPRYTLSFANLLRLTFIRINVVMNDDSIVSIFTDNEMSQFVKFALVLPTGDVLFDLKLHQAVPIIGADISQVLAYLDVPQIYHDVGVDLASAGPDPMAAPEAFFLKLLWPDYIDCDEKYLAIVIAGILSTRSQDQVVSSLPPYSMHLTEVGMHLKMLEAVDASLAWTLPTLKQEGLRLARFLGKMDTERYFSITDSPYHHSDKVVSLNIEIIWEDARKVWSIHHNSTCLPDSFLKSETNSIEIEEHLEYVTQSCAEAALENLEDHEYRDEIEVIDPSMSTKLAADRSKHKFDLSKMTNFAIDKSTSREHEIDRSRTSRREIRSDRRPFGRELDISNRWSPSRQ
eukprot:g4852.t1